MILIFFYTYTIHFHPTIEEKNGYSLIKIDNTINTGKVGGPSLPAIPLRDINTIIIKDSFDIKLPFPVYPFQKQLPLLFKKTQPFQKPDLSLYKTNSPIYIKSKKDLIFYPIKIITPDSIRIYREIEIIKKDKNISLQQNDSLSFDYLIVTTSNMQIPFENLAKWKQKLGLRTHLVLIEEIIKNYPGKDDSEKLRNYIKEMYGISKFKFLLLGGDTDKIPYRKAFAMKSEANIHSREDSLPCDLYFADLDGNWDNNNNGIYGEIEDNVDLYPDIVVGRIPVETYTEAQTICTKIIEYESGKYNDYQKDILFTASVLWRDPYTDAGIQKRKIKEKYLKSGYHIIEIYESEGMDKSDFIKWFNYGTNIVNQNGHGWYQSLGVGNGVIKNKDVDELTNIRKGIIYALGCWTAAFDFDCIAEHFLKNSNGGAIAYIGNSSYGWGSPGNPGFGYSDIMDNKFFSYLYSDSFNYIGEILNATKVYFIPFAREENLFRWHIYEVNLLGDPAMRFFIDYPKKITISVPDSINFSNDLPIYVHYRGKPVKGAIVSLLYQDSLIEIDTTDSFGKVILKTILEIDSTLYVWVSGKNIIPSYKEINIAKDSFIIKIENPVFSSSSTFQDTTSLLLSIINTGNEKIENLNLRITSANGIEIIDSSFTIEGINERDTIVKECFQFVIKSIQEEINFNIEAKYNNKKTVKSFSLPTNIGWLTLLNYKIVEPPLPQDSGFISLTLHNPGYDSAEDFKIYGISEKAYTDTITTSLKSKDTTTTFLKTYIKDAETGELIKINLHIKSNYFKSIDTLPFLIGYTGFSDDFENGLKKWTVKNKDGIHWHITDKKKYSGEFSLYCGDSKKNMVNSEYTTEITSENFYLSLDPVLSFKRKFQFPNYGTTGMYIIVESETKAETLDFIGSGGALILPISSDWEEVNYVINDFEPGSLCRIKLIFKSDGKECEGIYVDDIKITSTIENTTSIDSLSINIGPNIGKRLNFNIKLDRFSNIKIKIFNILGYKIKEISQEKLPSGNYSFIWEGYNSQGKKVPTGTYYIIVEVADKIFIKKVVFIE